MMLVYWLFLALTTSPRPTYSTWEEPMHEEVVRSAAAFVKATVIDFSAEEDRAGTATFKLEKRAAGVDVEPVFVVDGYSRLRLMSFTTGSYPQMRFRKGGIYWLFLERTTGSRSWKVATPESGSAPVTDGAVRAAYHNSIRLAVVPESLYEATQTAIFNHLHGRAADPALMKAWAADLLAKPPAAPTSDPSSDESKLFFSQHAILETFYYLGTESEAPKLEPFLVAKSGHVVLSALRALSRLQSIESKRRALLLLKSDAELGSKAAAVQALRRMNARELADELKALLPSLPQESAEYNLGIMDGRIGTRGLGSPRLELSALLREWSRAKEVEKR